MGEYPRQSRLDHPLTKTAGFGVLCTAGILGAGVVASEFGNFLYNTIGIVVNIADKESQHIAVDPPDLKVQRLTAWITGTAESEFPVEGSFNRLGCHISIKNTHFAKATIANKIGDFSIVESDGGATVTVNMAAYPSLEAGFDLEKSKDDINSGLSPACTLENAIDLQNRINVVTQASADTISDCIVAKPEFSDSLKRSMTDFVKFGHSLAKNIIVNLPPAPDINSSPARQNLQRLIAENNGGDNEVKAEPILTCDFKEFKVVPLSADNS